jgi:UDP-N-acetylmuramoyl-tripeptide--D-alanyl-D-alanine ligase
MTRTPLWRWPDLVAAANAQTDGVAPDAVGGFSLDTRALVKGDVFVALESARDGHEFVSAAFVNGAAAALVRPAYARQAGDRALLRVDDPQHALERIGCAARARLGPDAKVVAVTGSVGKTGTKEMLRACFSRLGPTHAPEKSFNNHWGVPLTLARMPADTRYGVFEIGMNHADEIRPLAGFVRPHAAIITTVEAVHLENFASIEGIADAKAEIIEGLPPGTGVAVLNRDNRFFDRLAARARQLGVEVLSFGRHASADVCALDIGTLTDGSLIEATIFGRRISYRTGAPGIHIALNSLAVAAALHAVGADVDAGLAALSQTTAPEGRGARRRIAVDGGEVLLVDESYNANPASMRAALDALALVPRTEFPRRIAVLGDMLELGPTSRELHAGLKEAVDAAGIDLVFACGPDMSGLFERLAASQRGLWAATSAGIVEQVLMSVRAGDAIVVKGSLGSRMKLIVDALAGRLGQRR